MYCKEAIREHANSGNLERHIRKSKWQKVFCVLKETILFVYRSKDHVSNKNKNKKKSKNLKF